MKKALIISYYWPPAGGGGVQRVAKFCKYLPEFGWEPLVLTVENGNFSSIDESLLPDISGLKHVYRAPSLEPHAVYGGLVRLLGRTSTGTRQTEQGGGGGQPGRLRQFGELVRLNLFVPDSRIGWRRLARKRGMDIIATEAPSIIFSTAPPYTSHLIASDLKRLSGLPWVADFRDPWLENHAYNVAPRLGFIKRWNRRLETGVLRSADRVCCATPGVRDLTEGKLPESDRDRFLVITNGYDTVDVRNSVRPNPRFSVSYFGTIYTSGFPLELFDAMRELIDADETFARDFILRVVGNTSPQIRSHLQQILPEHNRRVDPYIPHADMIDQLYESQVLVLVINDFPTNEAYAPGKLYEYLPTGNPILGLGPANSNAADILKETGGGVMLGYGDKNGVKEFLLKQHARWNSNALTEGPVSYPAFERKTLAHALAGVFNQLTA